MSNAPRATQSSVRNAVAAGFLGWTIDAFDFFVLVFAVSAIAAEFQRSIPAIALTLTASLLTRPVGAFVFGLLADRYGRRPILMANIVFYTLMEILSGLAPTYTIFFVLRLLYGIGMGGNWGVGASLALESVQAEKRGVVSGFLQEGYATGNLLAAAAYYTVFPHFGWRAMFFIGAIPAMLTLFLCTRVDEPRAWHESRTDWSTYRSAIFKNWRMFVYLVILMTMMTFISHGTQDMYPTFLQKFRHFDVSTTAIITAISMVGAIVGGLTFGHFSELMGRRRTMTTAALLAVCIIPMWIFAPNKPLLMVGAFLMQMMVQGAWGVVPVHINELSPPQLRGFFPGLAYQIGALISSSVGYIQAELAEKFSFATAMGGLAALVLVVGAIVIWLGKEAKGVAFSKSAS